MTAGVKAKRERLGGHVWQAWLSEGSISTVLRLVAFWEDRPRVALSGRSRQRSEA